MVFGAPRLEDNSFSLLFNAGSKWTVPLYSCASTSRAIIKTVDFRFNGTDGLKSLAVTNVKNKIYENENDKPYWGVEHPNMSLNTVNPLWGLVSERYKGRPNIDVIQKDSLYLPATNPVTTSVPVSTYMNLPGVSFHTGAFSATYNIGGETQNDIADYSGKTNAAMFSKWQKLSAQPDSTAKIINLVWTDVIANSVLGTRGWLSENKENRHSKRDNKGPPKEGNEAEVPVTEFTRKIRYHPAFAIPAIIVLIIASFVACTVMVLFVLGRARPSRMREYLFHTAAGRIMASLLYTNQANPQAPTKQWIHQVGGKRVTVASLIPQAIDSPVVSRQANTAKTNVNDPLIQKERAEIEEISLHNISSDLARRPS